ncbi:MAG: FmdB family zinc ribbon protein [Myxococcota bacterium]
MPIYEYRCRVCKNIFEELVRSGEQEINCPECKSKDVEKLISTFANLGGEGKSQSGSSCSSCSSGNCSHCH